jgi:hypothetical protein
MGALGALILAARLPRADAAEAEGVVFLTASTTAMVCWLFVGASSSPRSSRCSAATSRSSTSCWDRPQPPTFLILAQVIIFLLGWPLEWTEIIVIFVPIFLPLLKHFGVDPLFFGVLVALNLQTSFLTPPVAMAAFYLKGVAPPHVTINQIFQGVPAVRRHRADRDGDALHFPRDRVLAAELSLRSEVSAPWRPQTLRTDRGAAAAAEIAEGRLTAEDYARACLARVEARETDIRAFARIDREHVLAQARERATRSARRRAARAAARRAGRGQGHHRHQPTADRIRLAALRRPSALDEAAVVTKLREAAR